MKFSRSIQIVSLGLGVSIAWTGKDAQAAPQRGLEPTQALTKDHDDARAQAAARYSGRALADAGIYFGMYGGMTVAMSALYNQCSSTEQAGVCAPRVAVGLAVGGLVNLLVALPLTLTGIRRVKNPAGWIAKKSTRKGRMLAKASAKGIEAPSAGPSAVATTERGGRMSRGGTFTLIAAGVTSGLGVGLMPLSRPAGLGLNAVGVGLLVAGIGLAVGGKRRTFTPSRYARSRVRLAPALVESPSGSQVAGLRLSGRF